MFKQFVKLIRPASYQINSKKFYKFKVRSTFLKFIV